MRPRRIRLADGGGGPRHRAGGDGCREHWQRNARLLLQRPIDTHLRGGTRRAYVELRAALVLNPKIISHATMDTTMYMVEHGTVFPSGKIGARPSRFWS